MTPEHEKDSQQPSDPALASASGSDASNRTPAEVFSVGQHLQDEMDARGWSLDDLLNRMPGDRNLNQLWIEMVLAAHEFDDDIRKDLRLGDASALAHAFGTSKEFWENLDAAWVKHQNDELKNAGH